MRTIALLVASSLLPAVAFAWDSVVEDVQFTGETQVFQGTEYSEYVPVNWLPITVGIAVDAGAKLNVDMKADSELTWPTALTHQWDGVMRGGNLDLAATAGVSITIVDSDTGGTIMAIPAMNWAWTGSEEFDSLLLPMADGGPQSAATVEAVPSPAILQYSYTVHDVFSEPDPDAFLYNVDVTVGISLEPDVYLDVAGQNVVTKGTEITSRAGEAVIGLPSTHNGKYPLSSTWNGIVSGEFGIALVGTITVDWDGIVFSFPINLYTIDLAMQTDGKFAANTQQYTHNLPAIDVRSSFDAGEVLVGETKQVEIPVKNLGAIDLEGDVTFEGDAAFRIVGSDEVLVNGNQTDVLVVEFTPDQEGEFEGTLTFETNDPMMPTVEVPVFGAGIAATVDPGDNDGGNGDGDLQTRGCGCNGTPATAPFGLFAAGLLGLLARRRKTA